MSRTDLIICDRNIRGGIPTIKGTGIGAHDAAILAANDTRENVFKAFPRLTEEMLEAAIEFHRRAVDNASIEDEAGVIDCSPGAKHFVRSTRVRLSDL
jgi:uncharacterized protein (DUF433 family)